MRRFAALVALTATAPAYAGGGMPQMDPTWFANGFLWLVVSFALLYIVIARRIVPTISSVLAAREDAIGGAIREAELAKQEAEKTRGSAASEGNNARAKASEIIAKAQGEISREASEATAKLDRELTQRLSHVSAVLEDSVAKAKAGIEAASAELAAAMVARLTQSADGEETNAPKLKLAKR